MWPSSWYSTGLSTEELFKIVKKTLLPSDICYVDILPPGIEQGVFNCSSTPQDRPHLSPPVKKFWVHIISIGCCVYDFPWKTYNVMDDAGEFDSPWECVWVWPMWPLRRQSMDKRDLCLPPRPPFKAIHPILCPVHYVYHFMVLWHLFDQITFDRKPI